MISLKIIDELSEDTFNNFLKNLSFLSKRFMVNVRKEMKEKDISLNSKDLKHSIVLFLKSEQQNDPLFKLIDENQDRLGEGFKEWLKDLQKMVFYYSSLAQNGIENKAKRKEYFEMLFKLIESILIQGGESFNSTDYSQKVEKQLLALIQSNLTPKNVFQPKEGISVFFLQDMVRKLADSNYISPEFKKEQNSILWINRAFNVNFYSGHHPQSFQLKINWNKLVDLADWLWFLIKSCVEYNFTNNKQLYNWVVENVRLNGNEYSKGTEKYDNLLRTIRSRRDYIGYIFTIDENGLFKIK